MSTAILSPLEYDVKQGSADVLSVQSSECTPWSPIEDSASVSPAVDITRRGFACCCWLIALTSALDAFFAVYFKETIRYLEQNPICLQLIEWEPTFMSLFIAGKFTGTLLAIGVMIGLFQFRRHMGVAVAMAISAFQIGLIAYQVIA